MTLFPKFKNDNVISAKLSFYCFFIRTLFLVWGGGEGSLQKENVLYPRENDKRKWTTS